MDQRRERSAEARTLVSAREMAPVIAWALVVAGLTALPYLWAIGVAGNTHQFQGFIWGVDDGNVYLQWIRQAAEGELLLRNQYTTLEQEPHFFNVFLHALGRAAAWTGQPPGVVFHAARLSGAAALLVVIYLLAAFLSRSIAVRWAALGLASLGSGLGWAAAIWAQTVPDHLPAPLRPPDYAPPPPQTWQVMPEAVTFLSMLLNPLFVWSMAVMCLVLIGAVVTLERRSFAWAAVTGLLLLLIGNMHTYNLPVLHATMGLFGLIMVAQRRIRLRRALALYLLIFAIGLPAPLWAWWAANQDPAYMSKVLTKTLSPRPHDMAFGYGLILLLAIPGAVHAVRRRLEDPRLLLPLCWVAVNSVLLYVPVSFQRKMAEGLHIPLAILAAIGLIMVIAPRLAALDAPARPEPGVLPVGARRRERRSTPATPTKLTVVLLIILGVALTLPSNVLFVKGCMENVATNNRDLLFALQPPMMLTWDEVYALDYLARVAEPEEIVLSSSLTGSYVPTRAKCLVFAGHWAETLHFSDFVGFVHQFLAPGRSTEVLHGAVRVSGAHYVVYGPREIQLVERMGRAYDIEVPEDPAAEFHEVTAEFLEEVFARDTIRIYRFDREPEDREAEEGSAGRSAEDAR